MCDLFNRTRLSLLGLMRRNMLRLGVAAALLVPAVASGGVLSESDMQKVETLKPLFGNLMNDLAQTARRTDVAADDVNCVNSTIRELLEISDELASYEYLIAIDKDINDLGEKNPMRDLVRFAADKSSAILTAERKRLAQLSDQCARFPVGASKTRQTLQVIDTTTGILTAIRDRL